MIPHVRGNLPVSFRHGTVSATAPLPLVKPGGCFLAMKSVDSDDEIQSARGAMGQLGGKLESIRDYAIPGTAVTHRLVVIRKVKDTPPQFPRSWAKMKKAPLK